MLPLVEFPQLVQHYAPHFRGVFSDPAFIQFQRYISGLIVSENKTVDGINRLCVHESRHQSSLHRLLTESPFTVESLNHARLNLLQTLPGTRFKSEGVLSVDDTLLTHYGHHFEPIACLYHPVHEGFWAHNLVTLHYSDDTTDYPVRFRLWKPADLDKVEHGLLAAGIPLKASKQALKTPAPPQWRQYLLGVWRRHQKQEAIAQLYDSKPRIAQQLLTQFTQAHPDLKLPVTFDIGYTPPAFCRFLEETVRLPYVGTLKGAEEVGLKTGRERLDAFARRLKQEHLDAAQNKGKAVFPPVTIGYKGEQEQYDSDCAPHRLKNFGKQRLVINHRRAGLSDSLVFYISNRLRWQSAGLTGIRRHRWPVEVYHEEGKAEGLDQYQLRDFLAIERHIALVAVVYSLLRAVQQDEAFQGKLQRLSARD